MTCFIYTVFNGVHIYKTCIAQAKIKCVLGILFIIENILVISKCSNVQNQIKLINKKLL